MSNTLQSNQIVIVQQQTINSISHQTFLSLQYNLQNANNYIQEFSITEFINQTIKSLLQSLIFLLQTYPLNVIFIISIIVYVIYTISKKLFGLDSSISEYKKGLHIQDHSILVKNVKKDVRDMQTQLIHLKNKIQRMNAGTVLTEQKQKEVLSNSISQSSQKTLQTIPKQKQDQQLQNKMNDILQQIGQKQQFNQQMDRQLKRSMIEIVGILKKINNN